MNYISVFCNQSRTLFSPLSAGSCRYKVLWEFPCLDHRKESMISSISDFCSSPCSVIPRLSTSFICSLFRLGFWIGSSLLLLFGVRGSGSGCITFVVKFFRQVPKHCSGKFRTPFSDNCTSINKSCDDRGRPRGQVNRGSCILVILSDNG